MTEQVDGMTHIFTIALDHRLQFFDIFRCGPSLNEPIQAICYRQQSEKKIDTEIHNPVIVTQIDDDQYLRIEYACRVRVCN